MRTLTAGVQAESAYLKAKEYAGIVPESAQGAYQQAKGAAGEPVDKARQTVRRC